MAQAHPADAGGEALELDTTGRHVDCRRIGGEINASLKYGRMDRIFQNGLHELLTEFIECNNQLGAEIQNSFLNIHAA
ncbi:MAG: alpha-E domain-containing protein [Candidatus Methylopumilus sp.]|nr:alpha-E domain-containing protein [Candidatus Methylopumilus sp.]